LTTIDLEKIEVRFSANKAKLSEILIRTTPFYIEDVVKFEVISEANVVVFENAIEYTLYQPFEVHTIIPNKIPLAFAY